MPTTSHGRHHAKPVTWFTDHPASVGESYFGHMRFALGISGQLFGAAFAALAHAFLPALFETTAGNRIRALYARLSNRGHHG